MKQIGNSWHDDRFYSNYMKNKNKRKGLTHEFKERDC